MSESFEEGNEEKLNKWIRIYKNIVYGYDDVVGLTREEKLALPYVLLSNQLLALAWFAGQEKYAQVYETNEKMTLWLIRVFEELCIE